MKYSVIIPYFNSAMWLERCLNSLMQEGDFEFLLVNDRSTDGSEKVVECYTDPRIKMLDNTHKKGVSGARNTGLYHAKGDWITFLDADDEMLPNAYETFERMICDADIIQAEHIRHYASGKEVIKEPCDEGEYGLEELPSYWYMVWNKLYRADFLNNIRFVEGCQYGEDEVFNLECLAKSNRIVHTKELMTKRHFDNHQSLSKAKGREGLIKQCRALEDFLLRCDNPQARLVACDILSDHWKSDVYRRAFE